MSFLTSLVNGLSLGSIYAIIALGYTMVYGIAKMLNFAHGDFIMVGGYIIFTCVSTAGLPPAAGILLAIVLCTLLGIGTEKVAYKPLRHAKSNLAVLITAIGVSYLLENLALLIFGADTKSFTNVLQLFINHTKNGQAMLAVAQDQGAATLMGIDVNKTISLTFAIGSGLAAIAGALLCSAYPSLTPYTGAMPGIKAFVAAVLGGIGSIPGAMIGGLVLGIVEILSKTYISSQLSDAIVFGILVVVLLVKPTGLLGKVTQEKV